MEIKGLLEKLGLTQEQSDKLKEHRLAVAMQQLMFYGLILRRGGNIHGSDPEATAKRRAKNKEARRQRRRNRK